MPLQKFKLTVIYNDGTTDCAVFSPAGLARCLRHLAAVAETVKSLVVMPVNERKPLTDGR